MSGTRRANDDETQPPGSLPLRALKDHRRQAGALFIPQNDNRPFRETEGTC